MTSEDIETYFLKISKDPLNNLSQYIAPHLVGQEWYWIRRAILMILSTQNDTHLRNRLHMILAGAAGTGKTEVCLWFREQLNGIMINAELTSKVGLVGDARGNQITPGLLADADGNVLLTDELDKMNTKDQNGLLQAMEEGSFCIIKGKQRQRFKSEVRVIATANDIKKIQKPLLDRFDFIFYVGEFTRKERADNVNKITTTFITGIQDNKVNIVKRYMEWIQDHQPTIMLENKKEIDQIISDYILGTQTNINTVSYRSLEYSIMRIAYSMAKLEKNNIGNKHINDAIWLKDQILRGIVG